MTRRPYLTTGECALLLGVSAATVRRYVEDGRLEAMVLPSGHRRVTRASLDRLRAETTPVVTP